MRDDFDLHARAFRQAGDLDGRARGKIFREIFRVNFVHAREVREIGQEHGAFDDVGERQLLIVQNRFDVFQHALGLRLDVAGNQIAVFRVNRNLAGAEQQVANAHGVIIRADGGR